MNGIPIDKKTWQSITDVLNSIGPPKDATEWKNVMSRGAVHKCSLLIKCKLFTVLQHHEITGKKQDDNGA